MVKSQLLKINNKELKIFPAFCREYFFRIQDSFCQKSNVILKYVPNKR